MQKWRFYFIGVWLLFLHATAALKDQCFNVKSIQFNWIKMYLYSHLSHLKALHTVR